MDRLIAANSVDAGHADVAPGAGTPAFATSGNPGVAPATQFPAYQYNAIQEELMAIITAAALAPARTNNAQVLAAIRTLIGNQSGNFYDYAGNPNGNVAGRAGNPGVSPPDFCWDSTNNILYVCSVTGGAGAANWITPTGTGVNYSGGVTAGTAAAQTLAVVVPSGFALALGVTVTASAGFNSVAGGTTMNVAGSGNVAVYKNTGAGPAPIGVGDQVLGDLYSWTYNGAYWIQGQQSLGVLALLGIGAGLRNQGDGNAQANDRVVAGATGVLAGIADHRTCKVNAAAAVYTIPLSTGLWSGWAFDGYSLGGTVTITPNGADAINGGTTGASLLIAQGCYFRVTTDAAGNLMVFVQQLSPQTLWVQEEQASGTNSADGAMANNAWNTRTLNTIKLNSIPGVSLSGNQITLPAGQYDVRALSPCFNTDGFRIRLYNVTDGAPLVAGNNQSVRSGSYGNDVYDFAPLIAAFTLTAAKTIRLEMWPRGTTGLTGGDAVTTGDPEVYSSVFIRKTA